MKAISIAALGAALLSAGVAGSPRPPMALVNCEKRGSAGLSEAAGLCVGRSSVAENIPWNPHFPAALDMQPKPEGQAPGPQAKDQPKEEQADDEEEEEDDEEEEDPEEEEESPKSHGVYPEVEWGPEAQNDGLPGDEESSEGDEEQSSDNKSQAKATPVDDSTWTPTPWPGPGVTAPVEGATPSSTMTITTTSIVWVCPHYTGASVAALTPCASSVHGASSMYVSSAYATTVYGSSGYASASAAQVRESDTHNYNMETVTKPPEYTGMKNAGSSYPASPPASSRGSLSHTTVKTTTTVDKTIGVQSGSKATGTGKASPIHTTTVAVSKLTKASSMVLVVTPAPSKTSSAKAKGSVYLVQEEASMTTETGTTTYTSDSTAYVATYTTTHPVLSSRTSAMPKPSAPLSASHTPTIAAGGRINLTMMDLLFPALILLLNLAMRAL